MLLDDRALAARPGPPGDRRGSVDHGQRQAGEHRQHGEGEHHRVWCVHG
jgi:hypothetical protein